MKMIDNNMSRTCEGYECGSTKVIMTLPEFGNLCRGCYEELKDEGRIKTVYIQGDY